MTIISNNMKDYKYLINYTIEIIENEFVLLPTKRVEKCEITLSFMNYQFAIEVINELLRITPHRVMNIKEIKYLKK